MALYNEFKDLNDFELAQRINDMVNQQENESQELDFKRIDSIFFVLKTNLPSERKLKKNEFAKDLAAFANATGGVIIYGIDETYDEKTDQRTIKSFGQGIKKVDFNREQFIQIANSAVVPTVTGLQVRAIEHPADKDAYIIVVLIPETGNGAIMVQAEGDHCFRYFQRQVTENKPMLNWQVRLINNKIINPQLILRFNTYDGLYFIKYRNNESALVIRFPKIKNVGKVLANQVGFVMRIPNIFRNSSNITYFNELIDVRETKDYFEKMKVFNHPIFPGLEVNTFSEKFELSFNFPADDLFGVSQLKSKRHNIRFSLFADNSEPKIYNLLIDYSKVRCLEDLYKLGIDDSATYNYYKDIPELLKVENWY